MAMTRFANMLRLVVLAQFFGVCAASLSTLLGSGTEECFVVRAPADAPAVLTGNFDCLNDELSADPISVVLIDHTDDDNEIWTSAYGVSEDEFDIHLKRGGRFSLCLRNGMGKANDDQDRAVGFAFRVRPPSRAMDDKEQGPDGERALQLVEWASDLSEGWETLLDHYDFLRERENVQKELEEATLQRVVRWTLLEAVLLISIATAQVMHLRKFFEKRRYL